MLIPGMVLGNVIIVLVLSQGDYFVIIIEGISKVKIESIKLKMVEKGAGWWYNLYSSARD